MALVQSVNDSRRAWRNFFDSATGKCKGRKVGRPRMKSRKDHRQSFRLTRNGFRVRPNGRLFVAKVGEVRVRWSRELPRNRRRSRSPRTRRALLRQLRRRRRCVAVAAVAAEAGVDVGLTRWRRSPPATTAHRRGESEHWRRKLRKLRRLEREKSRRQKGSPTGTRRGTRSPSRTTRWRGPARLSPQAGLALVRENQVIHVEDLNIVGMVKNAAGTGHQRAGWGQFVRIIGEKADRYGRTVHTVSRWLASSKTCSTCGHRLDELRSSPSGHAGHASAVHDRDHNAAKVILAAGRAERLNACGALVSPPSTREARGDEAGSTPTAA